MNENCQNTRNNNRKKTTKKLWKFPSFQTQWWWGSRRKSLLLGMLAVIYSLKKWQLWNESSNCCGKIICSAEDNFSASWYLGDNFMWRKTKQNLQNTFIKMHEKVKCIYFPDCKQFLLLDTQTLPYRSWWQF